MAKELYIYSPIYDYTAEVANKQLSTVSETDDLVIRFNSPGGEVNSGFAFLSKLSERQAKTKAIIDGQAKSMAAYMLPFIDYVISNDTSEIMFHKAAYPDWYKASEQEQASLDNTNKIFKEKMTKKVSGKKGSEEFLAKLFEEGKRNDVELSPKQALELGIVNEVRKLEPKAYYGMQIVALHEEKEQINTPKTSGDNINTNLKIKSMDLVQFKAEHPALYAEVFGLGEKAGIQNEKERVQAWAVYYDIDAVKVKAGIEGNGLPTAKDQNEFVLASIKGKKVSEMEKENPKETNADKEAKTEEELKMEAQKAEMDALFNDKGE